MTHFVDLQQSDVISEHIASLCGEAKDATYTRESDLHKWANIPGKMKWEQMDLTSFRATREVTA